MLYFVIRAISNLFDLYSIALIVYALLSWFPGAYQTKFGEFLTRIVEPYLKLFRRLPLQFAGLDFTVWVAILALNLFKSCGLLFNKRLTNVIMMKDLYQHFSHEDREFIDRSLELLQRVQDTYAFETTSFLNPHQVSILKNIGKQYDVQVFASSDYFPSELARVLVAPSYYQLNMDDFELSLLEISYASKFYKISHSQIMGTLLNQLGIERRTFGDILVVGERAQLFVDKRLAQYFIDHVSKIAKMPVKLKEVSFAEQLKEQKQAVTREILASSLRLDKLVASTFKLSRSQAAQLISGKRVKINYAVNDNPSQQVGLEDLISVRRFGRFKVLRENGLSKNGKHKLTVELLASK